MQSVKRRYISVLMISCPSIAPLGLVTTSSVWCMNRAILIFPILPIWIPPIYYILYRFCVAILLLIHCPLHRLFLATTEGNEETFCPLEDDFFVVILVVRNLMKCGLHIQIFFLCYIFFFFFGMGAYLVDVVTYSIFSLISKVKSVKLPIKSYADETLWEWER